MLRRVSSTGHLSVLIIKLREEKKSQNTPRKKILYGFFSRQRNAIVTEKILSEKF